MADVTINQLPVGAPTGSSIIPIVTSNTTQQTTVSQLSSNIIDNLYLPKIAFVNFVGTGAAGQNCLIRSKSSSITSVFKNATAIYTINIASGFFSNSDYCISISQSNEYVSGQGHGVPYIHYPFTTGGIPALSPSPTQIRFAIFDEDNGNVLIDKDILQVVLIGT